MVKVIVLISACLIMIKIAFSTKLTNTIENKLNNLKSISITVKSSFVSPKDTLFLRYLKGRIDLGDGLYNPLSFNQIEGKKENDNDYNFQINNQEIKYISFVVKRHVNEASEQFLEYYLAEPVDSITIETEVPSDGTSNINARPKFSGRGYEKYECKYLIDNIAPEGAYLLTSEGEYREDNVFDDGLIKSLGILERYRNSLNPDIYEIMKADIFGKYAFYKMNTIAQSSSVAAEIKVGKSLSDKSRRLIQDLVESVLKVEPKDIKTTNKIFSSYWARYLILRYKLEFGLENGKINNYNNRQNGLYYFIKTKCESGVLDKVLTYLLQGQGSFFITNTKEIFQDAMETVTIPQCKDAILALMNSRQPGKLAYSFNLPDVTGKRIKLEEFRDKVVLIDFWFTGCGGCSAFYKNTLVDVEKHFKSDSNVVFVSISVDKEKNQWTRSINKEIYTSPDVINVYTESLGVQHPIVTHYNISGYPTTLLINREGKICNFQGSELRDKESLIRIIEQLSARKIQKTVSYH